MYNDYAFVSIHAPAWGATREDGIEPPQAHVSIHAPAWGATIFFSHLYRCIFVSIHAPAWGATAAKFEVAKFMGVSIHAPAWGATLCKDLNLAFLHCFNPRARMGRDSNLFNLQITNPLEDGFREKQCKAPPSTLLLLTPNPYLVECQTPRKYNFFCND